MKTIKAKIHWFLTDEKVNEVLVRVFFVLSAFGWAWLIYSVAAVLLKGQ